MKLRNGHGEKADFNVTSILLLQQSLVMIQSTAQLNGLTHHNKEVFKGTPIKPRQVFPHAEREFLFLWSGESG